MRRGRASAIRKAAEEARDSEDGLYFGRAPAAAAAAAAAWEKAEAAVEWHVRPRLARVVGPAPVPSGA